MIRYKLDDVVEVISEREDNPSNSMYDKFVGLEHYIPGEVEIKNYGNTHLLVSAMKVFHSGDILIARRNVYLKRSSVVNFDGITSGDSIVLRAKDKLIHKLLPFILNTDNFWGYAEKFSDGTMSKRLSPRILLEYEFALPELKKQEELAKLLWTINDTKNAYEKLITLTDDLIKSQFVEMFGPASEDYEHWPVKRLEDISQDMRTGPFGSALLHSEFVDSGVFVLGIDNAVENHFSYNRMRYITEEKYEQLKRYTVHSDDVIITLMGTVGRSAIIPEEFPKAINTKHLACLTLNKNIADPHFICYAFQHHPILLEQLNSQSKGAVMDGLNLTIIKRLQLALPPLKLQNQFAAFVQQVDKSKFELQRTIDGLESTYKSLLRRNLG